MRKLSLCGAAVVLVLAALLGSVSRDDAVSGDAAGRMRRASVYFDSLVVVARAARTPAEVTAPVAVSLGYLERLRLGLGSPFRLMDFALHDPRLDSTASARVAWALLDRTRRGDDYVVDPRVLSAIGPERGVEAGAAHVALIEQTIDVAPDAREGELAIRLGYALAAGERTIDEAAVPVVAEVAALARDRRLAREDAGTLFRRAAAGGATPFDELGRMRAARQLAVEQPSPPELPPESEARAVDGARRVLDALRRFAVRPTTDGGERARHSLLGPVVAARLAELGASLPLESPVAVSVRSYRTALDDDGSSGDASRQRFASGALNEETLTAQYALLRASGDSGAASALALTAAATALRAYAQEAVWFPGDRGPTPGDLRAEFGVADVTFDRDVPEAWRPYYLRLVQTSIRDAQRVLVGLSLAGVRIHYSVDGLPDSALAMHDPGSRTLRLSIRSSAGTLAHEFAHDLDWQAARSLYVSGGGYSTDRAARDGEGPLSRSVRGLAAARLVTPLGGGTPNESGRRPAELFARDMDWFMAVSLASEGRMDGYLSAVQDAALTGYAAVAPEDITPRAGRALMDAAAEMTYVPEPLRESFLARWADPASADPYLLVRRVLDARPLRWRGGPSSLGEEPRLPSIVATAVMCVDAPPNATPEVRTRVELLDLALDARARGIARGRASWYPAERRPAWAHGVLGEAPWSPDAAAPVIRRIRSGVAAELAAAAATTMPLQSSFPTFSVRAGSCDR